MKPTPKHTMAVCDACGLPWSDHEARASKVTKGKVAKEPTLETCVVLLKEALTRARANPLGRQIASSASGTLWQGRNWASVQ